MSEHQDDLAAIDKMAELKTIGEPLGLTFGPGLSKERAKEMIREARANADQPPAGDGGDEDGGDDEHSTATPADAAPRDGDGEPGERRAIVDTTERGDWRNPFTGKLIAYTADVDPANHVRRDGDEAVWPEA